MAGQEKKKDVPEIRFAGFTDPWEQRKFADIAVIRRGLTYSPADLTDSVNGIRVLRSSNIYDDQFVLNDDDVFVNENAVNIALVNDGDILITAANGSPRLVGKRARIGALTGKTVHGGFMFVASSDHSDFLCASMGSNWYRKFLATGVAGGNGAIGNLDSKALNNADIAVPGDTEKDRLGDFFSSLDTLITLHQRECDQLKTFKKSMLEKMFPREGESIPEIRFAGFTDPWEQRKLGELLTFRNGFNGSSNSFGSGVPLISVMDVLADGFISYDSIKGKASVTPEEADRFSVEYGDVLFQRSSENYEDAGSTNVYLDQRKRAIFGGFVIRGRKTLDYEPRFIKHALRSRGARSQITRCAQGAQHINVSQDTLERVVFPMPSLAEQRRIGALFSSLDSLITLHQRELELLKNIKKAMLEKMFV